MDSASEEHKFRCVGKITQKYHYSSDEHHYSLTKRRVHYTIVLTPICFYLFHHRSKVLTVKLDDERWRNGQIAASYEEKKLTLTVDVKSFLSEMKNAFSPPKSFDHGVLIFACNVKLPPEAIEKLCREPDEAASSMSSAPAPAPPPSSSSSTTPAADALPLPTSKPDT